MKMTYSLQHLLRRLPLQRFRHLSLQPWKVHTFMIMQRFSQLKLLQTAMLTPRHFTRKSSLMPQLSQLMTLAAKRPMSTHRKHIMSFMKARAVDFSCSSTMTQTMTIFSEQEAAVFM